MCGASLSPDPRDSKSCVRASEQKIPGRDLALQATRDRDGERRHKAAANMPRKNRTAPCEPICPTEFPVRASQASNASCETARRLLAMFPVLISYCLAYYHPSNMSRGKSGVAEGDIGVRR